LTLTNVLLGRMPLADQVDRTCEILILVI
jgi:hypothetical protein